VLKSKWLDGKRNRRVDMLIHTLVRDLMPDIEDRHKWHSMKKRDDLEAWCWHTILARALEIPHDFILKLEGMRFQVHSSTQELFFDVDLVNSTCTCSDFPRIEFCKHIASAEHFFRVGKAGPTSQPSLIEPASLNTKNGNTTYDVNSVVSLISVTNKIIALSQELLMHTPKPEDVSNTVKSLRSVSKHLAAVVASGTGDGPLLPEKEQIAPNQHSWTETAQRMGVKRIKKRRGKVDSALTAEHISEINRKRTRENEDPYGAGEQSGKRAKQDARSVAANS
jgi:hypothetical protein